MHSGEHKEKQRKVKHLCRRDKGKYIHELCIKLEEEHSTGNSKGLFQVVKKLNSRFRPRSSAIKDKNGILLTEEQEIKNRWLQYVKDLFEKGESTEQQYNWEDKNNKEQETLVEEVDRAIKRISNNIAAGIDEIPIELVKNEGKYTVKTMHKLFCLIWNMGKWSKARCKAVYVSIPKKRDLQRCENYRTISLISHISKILLIIMAERIKQKLETEIAGVQVGFRKGRGTGDQKFNLRQLMEKSRESNSHSTCV